MNNNSANDLIDAKLEEHQLCGSKHCPGCGHKLEGSTPDWLGLPAGVKFDPTDQELIEHLQAKVEGKSSNSSSHPLIDEFIPTIDGEDGICYTHPEKLPGVTRDGLSRHFFHRPSKAYTTGTRKRRKIQTECDLQGGETRWHKTGKTRPVMMNGKQKGCKKILVLYTNFGKNRKPEKTNWVMHQYHLGQNEEEKEGELVVSKIFYQTQPRQCNWTSERTATTGDNNGSEPSGRRESGSGSGSTSSSKEVIALHNRDDQLSISAGVVGSAAAAAAAAAAALSSYNSGLDMQHFRTTAEHFSFVPFSRKAFDEAQAGIGDASTVRDTAAMSAACDEHQPRPQHQHQHHLHHPHPHHAMADPHDQHQHHHHQHHHTHNSIESTAAFHINRPSHPISQIISPPPLHHASIILDDDSFQHVSRIMLQNDNFHHQQQQQQQQEQQQQQTQQQQHHHKLGGRSAAGLEEIIMGCTSSSSPAAAGVKEESSMTNPPVEADWMKYSTFWHDNDHSDHHG